MIRTVSLETAKLLKEAGFRQDNAFMWECLWGGLPSISRREEALARRIQFEHEHKIGEGCEVEELQSVFSAPTTDELIDELPSFITYCGSPTLMLTITKIGHYRVDYERNDDEKWCEIHQVEDKSLPEALAQMWLWLKKENLIS